ncbi:MAG: hypothetical protein ACM3WT_06940, partial [Bacillota bacterium]
MIIVLITVLALAVGVGCNSAKRVVSVRSPSAPQAAGAVRLGKYAFVDTEGLGVEGFTMLVPRGWQVSGGIRWRKERPLLPASLAFRLASQEGTKVLECFPDESYFWVDAQGLLFPHDYGPELRLQYAR